ncbi:hypothetical protein NPIL_671961 [Nephila pilipes]|uniref:Uncharacterized protein n=1 Tax=Nephila pilipes TaxID=299642 RepID=A0A8X6TP40_NEPPI|nr:hypothetical protein NPIL_671961 [Nephila pilipes]
MSSASPREHCLRSSPFLGIHDHLVLTTIVTPARHWLFYSTSGSLTINSFMTTGQVKTHETDANAYCRVSVNWEYKGLFRDGVVLVSGKQKFCLVIFTREIKEETSPEDCTISKVSSRYQREKSTNTSRESNIKNPEEMYFSRMCPPVHFSRTCHLKVEPSIVELLDTCNPDVLAAQGLK